MASRKKNNAVKNCNLSAATLCSRIMHVSLTIGITITLFIKHTNFRTDLENGHFFHPVIYLFAVLTSLILYFVVACMDPGYVKRGDPDVKEIQLILDDDENDDDISLYEVHNNNSDRWNVELNETVHNEKTKMLGNEIRENNRAKCFNLEPHERCGLCGLQRPLRAKHCRDCKRCVRKFDHHCPWITNCVGERNHKWFYIFLIFNLAILCWSMYISTTGYASAETPSKWASQNIILVLVDILIAILILVVGALFCIHTYLMLNNHTTWETMSRQRITYFKGFEDSTNPFNLGACRNVFVFFCNFRPYDWTVVYSKTKQASENCVLGEDDEFCEITVDNP